MSFKLKRVVNRIIATCLVTITLLSVVPFGVFAPINAFAENDYFEFNFVTTVQNRKDVLNDNNGLVEENHLEFLYDREGTSILKEVPYIGFRMAAENPLNPLGENVIVFMLPAYRDNGNAFTTSGDVLSDNMVYIRTLKLNASLIDWMFKGAELRGISDNLIDERKIFNRVKLSDWEIEFKRISHDDSTVGVFTSEDWSSKFTNSNKFLMSHKQLELVLELLDNNKDTVKVEGNNINLVKVDNGFKLSNELNFKFDNISVKDGKILVNIDGTKREFNLADIGIAVKIGNSNCVKDNAIELALKDYKTYNEEYYKLNLMVKSIIKSYVDEELAKKEVVDKEGETAVDDEKAEQIVKALDEGKSYEAWMLLMNNFFNTGHTSITEEDRKYLGLDSDDDLYKSIKNMRLEDYGYAFIKNEFMNKEGENNFAYPPNYTVETLGSVSYMRSVLSDYDNQIENYKVSPYEDLLLRIYYSTQRQYRYISEDGRRTAIETAISSNKLDAKFAINSAFNMKQDGDSYPAYFYKDMPDNKGLNVPDLPKSGNEMISEAKLAAQTGFGDLDEKTEPNVKILAQNFEPAMKYILYGVLSQDGIKSYETSPTNTGTLEIPYCENATKVIPSLDLDGGSGNVESSNESVIIMSENIDFSKFGFPDLSNVTRIVNNEFSRNKISQIYISLMYIKKYASLTKEYDKDNIWIVKNKESLAGLSLIEDEEFSDYSNLDESDIQNVKIEDFLNKVDEAPAEERSSMSPGTTEGKFIKAYISIHDGMDYIGLKPTDDWVSVELRKIYNYYDRIKSYKDAVATEKYDDADLEASQPFGEFFKLEDDGNSPRMLSDYINMGIGASATYLPLVTNTFDYDAISIIDNPDFIEKFHYKYGFHRKALFIDSNSNAALQSYVTGSKDSLKIATLEDFMQPDKDIVLYIDTNFYNIKTLAEKQNLSYSKLQNTEEASKKEQGLLEGVADMWSEWRSLDAASICKTAGANLYSDALGDRAVQAYGTDKQQHNFWEASSKNHYVLSSDAIDKYYRADEYSDTQSFAFVSGIYRCSQLLTICQNESANPKPVFISSPTLPFVEGVSKKEFNSIYNYLMVKNLKANLGLDYKTELDLSSPLFMDVYGNITTQSGLVVIPAASNATLYDANKYSIITAGLASLANSADAWQIPADANNVEKMIDSGFVKDPNTETYKMQNKSTNTVSNLNMNNLPLQSEKVKKILYNDAYTNAATATVEGNLFNQRVNTIMEVMRGAPIENINFDDEGLSGFRNLDKTGIYIAYRIEQLGDMLLSSSEGNSLLKMPNLAFMEGVEYVVVIVFKILLAAGVFLLWFKLYADGMSNNLGIRTGIEFIVSIASVVIGIILIPTLINFSYYQTNKQLLQDEAAYLLMLNTEKNAEGKEVGIKEVKAPSSTTKFYIKLNEIKVPWWTVMQDIYSPEMFQTMEQVYEEAYSTSIYSSFDGAMKRGNGIYINTDDLFKSSEIRFIPDDSDNPDSEDTGKLVQAVLPNNRMSYVMPYYAIIDSLLANVAEYNDVYKSTAYRTKILQNGNVRTIGLLESYFKSNLFLNKDEMNLFGFYDMYDIPYSTDFRRTLFTDNDIDTMSKSLWYNKDAFTDEEVAAKLEELDQIGKRFIVENRTLLNKVTDETFIKVFALYMSVQHNNLFKVPAARGIELMEIDTKDIIRLSLAPKGDVMHSISMSFGRFTFTKAGTFGTILMAFLLLIYYFTSLIRPVVMIILVGGLIFSYVWKKLMRYEQNHSLEGYIVSCALICLVNLIYALVIKVSVMLPNFGVDPIFSILMQIVLQAAYTGVLYLIGYVVLKNCRDLGYFTYKTFYDAHMANKIQSISMSANKLIAKSIFAPFSNTANNMRNEYLGNRRTAGLTGDDIYNRMQQTDEERYNNIENNYHRRY